MLLAIDIGNTNIVLGIYHQGCWQHHWRIATVTSKMADEYTVTFKQLFDSVGLDFSSFKVVSLSSVVPQLTQAICQLFAERCSRPPRLLQADSPHGLTLKTSPTSCTGTDLIANAIAAKQYYPDACIVVDFGTATTLSLIVDGCFEGAIIAAGLRTTAYALVGETAQLPSIDLTLPEHVLGTTTVGAMQSGLVLGHLCLIEGLITRLKKQTPQARVIATGGFATTLGKTCDLFDKVDPLLTLDGLRLFAES